MTAVTDTTGVTLTLTVEPPGVDQIYSVMLKNLANELAIPLSHIFKCSMATGIVPEDWRIANVVLSNR